MDGFTFKYINRIDNERKPFEIRYYSKQVVRRTEKLKLNVNVCYFEFPEK